MGTTQSAVDDLIDHFAITIPRTLSDFANHSKSLTVQGQHGIGRLALAYFNLTTDSITSCSSEVSTLSTSSPNPTSKINNYRNT